MSDSIIYLDMFPQKEAAKIAAMLSGTAACPYNWQCHLAVLLFWRKLKQLFYENLDYELFVLGRN